MRRRAYQNARLTQDLELRVRQRTAELSRAHHSTETLLKVITELSTSLDINQVLIRTLTVLNEAAGALEGTVGARLQRGDGEQGGRKDGRKEEPEGKEIYGAEGSALLSECSRSRPPMSMKSF